MRNIVGRFFCLAVLLAFNQISYSQEKRYSYQLEITYQLHWQPDSNNHEKIDNEFFTLLIGKRQSLFCATQYLVMDSAITAEAEKGNSFGPPMSFFEKYGTHNSQVIFKSGNLITTYDYTSRYFSKVLYSYKEQRDSFNWEILNDTITIASYKCQKATAFFGNRMWVAWFAPQIPVSDGPYKFNGLPGLILKISDSKNYWNFDLAGLKNIDRVVNINFQNKKAEPLRNKEEFLKKKKYARDNRFELRMLDGWKFSNPAGSKKEYVQEAIKDNNWIELPPKNDSK